MKKEILINAILPEETRIAIVEDGVLEELYIERVSNENIVGNIYKGRIVNIEPSIQAAFVDFGIGRNGFLHISDVDPSYFEAGGLIEEIKEGKAPSKPASTEKRRSSRPADDEGDDEPPRRSDDRPRRKPSRPAAGPPADTDWDESPAPSAVDDQDDAEGADPDAPKDARSRHRDDDEQGDGGRRRGRRRRGRRRGRGSASDEAAPAAEPQESDPEEHAFEDREPNELPDLEDYQLEHDTDLHDEHTSRKEVIDDEVSVDVESAEEVAIEDDVDDFGSGLFEEEDDDEGPREPDSVYRRTTPDDDFGEGLFDDSNESDDEEDEAEEESESDAPEEIEAEASDDDDVEPVELTERSESSDEIDDPFSGFQDDEPRRQVVSEDSEDSSEKDEADEESSDAPRGRRRRRRGRRGRRDDESPRGDAEESSEGGRDEEDEPEERAPVRERRPRSSRSERGGRSSEGHDRDGRSSSRGRGGPRRDRQQPRWVDPRRPKDRPPIQDIFRRGQEVVVQVIKEGIGNKGPTLSTYVSIPGRYLVAMPGFDRVGVSRKIEDIVQRRRLRDIMQAIDRPPGVGFIVRTAGVDRSQEELERDMTYLNRLWEVVVRRIKHQPAPTVVYQESDVIIRTIRDIFNQEVDRVWIDDRESHDRAKDFMRVVMPELAERIHFYDESTPMFNKFHIEEEIFRIQQRTVPLEKGGSIVIEQAEALVAIDVNSGNFRADDNAEETAFQMNMAAAKEIARQLRLRDLGGVIVNDFIDMKEERHRRAVENCLRDSVRRDRAKTKILRMSQFGLIEMTRQRIRPSLRRSLYRECPMCLGTGHVKTVESMSIDCMRLLIYVGQSGRCRAIQMIVDNPIAEFLNNHKRKALADIEDRWRVTLNISGRQMTSPEELDLRFYDGHGNELDLDVKHLMNRGGTRITGPRSNRD